MHTTPANTHTNRISRAVSLCCLMFCLSFLPPANAASDPSDWGGDAWEYTLNVFENDPAPLPPRVDPSGTMRLIGRGGEVRLQHGGREIPLVRPLEGLASSCVTVADIDFDGKPEFFVMISFGSAGDFYAMADADGGDATLRRLFGPYLDRTVLGDDGRAFAFLFDGLRFDRKTKSLRLSSGGIANYKMRTFSFRGGKYALTGLSGALPYTATFGGVRFEAQYTLDEERERWTRAVRRPGGETAPVMRVLRDAELRSQDHAAQWTHPPQVAAKLARFSVDYAQLRQFLEAPVPFSLGRPTRTVRSGTWVRLLDLAALPGTDRENGPNNEPEIWCKIAYTDIWEKERSGWVPEGALFLGLWDKPALADRPGATPETGARLGGKYYAAECAATPEGEWLYLQTDSGGGWARLEDVKRWADQQ